MKRLLHLTIAFRNFRGGMVIVPFLFPALLAAWIVAVVFTAEPEEALVRVLCWLAVGSGFTALAGLMASAIHLRRKHPPLLLGGASACFVLAALCFWLDPSVGLAVRLSLPCFVSALLCYYVFSLSMLPKAMRVHRIGVGDRFPGFDLPNSANQQVTLASLLAEGPALLLFYKGDW
jgi:hypothetical protein